MALNREVVLTGIHLSSYGTEHMEGSPVKGGDWDSGPLWDLIERIHRVEGLERIRLGSLEPRIITREFAEKLAGLPGICPSFPPLPPKRLRCHIKTHEPPLYHGGLSQALRHTQGDL